MEQLQIINTLKDIGVKPSLTGFKYLVRAIQEYESCNSKMEAIYRRIARQYSVTRASVERNIRHCITNCFDRTMTDVIWTKYFSNTIDCDKGKPTVKEFIACIAQYINTKEVK